MLQIEKIRNFIYIYKYITCNVYAYVYIHIYIFIYAHIIDIAYNTKKEIYKYLISNVLINRNKESGILKLIQII